MDLTSLSDEKQRGLLDALLDRLEKKEYAALAWGFTEGAFTEDELDAEAQAVAGNLLDAPGELWDKLYEQRLLLRLRQRSGEGGVLYRSRFAETIRLLFRLRQLFPPLRPNDLPDWIGAKTLVADYRLIRKPRRYPRRDVSSAAVLRELSSLSLPPRQERAVRQLLQRGNQKIDLARFQYDATRRILGSQDFTTHQGTIVCAGTGTGKTLAFYLPVFARLTDTVRAGVHDTLCLALYPRNELLKDQFRTAYDNARLLDGIGDRKLRIGVYFGSTPSMAASLDNPNNHATKSWLPRLQGGKVWGRVCPFLPCPACRGELVWRQEDYGRAQPIEQLWCENCQRVTVPADTIVLTRQRMHEGESPDILFTTTEMLNRSLCERERHRMLGIGTRKLRFLLLDEAHTYAGVSGAQNALVIRRWKYAVQTPCHFVGLSATLREPTRFFAQLIDEPEGSIGAVTVQEQDMESEGWEYQLALRGDASAQASLLSTSVQTVMLLARMLDPLNNQKLSDLRFPPKLFAFTDDLDVTNRFYHTLQDAENYGRPVGSNGQRRFFPLAMERRDDNNGVKWPDVLEREKQGQIWNACKELGNSLSDPLRLDKVSSQDAGVDIQAKVVIATAALEVGYDDSSVGAMVQHKSARSAASFLQRKGRAGRQRSARPWSVIVLSDFGRDRMAYQGYEQLFDPELDRTDLPVNNRYVLKIQATFALLDYIGTTIRGNYKYHWDCLSRPGGYESHRTKIRNIAHDIMTVSWHRKKFKEYLQGALGIDAEQAVTLLWQAPRSLMTEVLPTVVRRMETDFVGDFVPSEDGSAVDDSGKKAPLPEFLTSNLFSNLLVPEVEVVALRRESSSDQSPEYTELQGVLSALQQTSPGRVTRRYAVRRDAPSNHWVPPGHTPSGAAILDAADQDHPRPLRIADYLQTYDVECQTQWRNPARHGAEETITVYRPRRICLSRAEDADPTQRESVDTQSRTALQWHSQFHPIALPQQENITVAEHIGLRRWVRSARFFCFSTGNPLRARRFAVGAVGTLYVRRTMGQSGSGPMEKRPLHLGFVESDDTNQRAAVGFETDVDAVGFHCEFPEGLLDEVLTESVTELRAPYFIYRVRDSRALRGYSIFDRDWFAQTALSIFAAVAHGNGATFQEVIDRYRSDERETKDRWQGHVAAALDAIFQLTRASGGRGADAAEPESELTDEEDEDTGDDGAGRMPLQREQLEKSLREDAVRHALLECGTVLYESPDASWHPWLEERLRATLGAALLSACEEVASEFNTSELYLDVSPGAPSHEGGLSEKEQSQIIWISESIPGGAGVIEEVRRVIRHEEERFFLMAANALQTSRAERLHRSLRRIVDLTQNVPVRDALQSVRNTSRNGNMNAFNSAREKLLDVLRKDGVSLSHSVANALNVRILHPASSEETDSLLRDLFVEWEATEASLQTELDARIFAYLALQSATIREKINRFLSGVGGAANPKQRYNAVYSMLWPRGYMVRDQSPESYNPFAPIAPTDPLLLERQMASWHTSSEVRGGSISKLPSLIASLQTHGITEWIVPESEREEARETLLALIRTSIDCGLLIGYARVDRVSQRIESGDAQCIMFTLSLPEAGYTS